MNAGNVLAYCGQLALLVAVCAPLPRLLGLRSPVVQHVFWRTLLAICLLLPILQPWRMAVMEFVPAAAADAGAQASAPPPPPPAAASRLHFDWVDAAAVLIPAGAAARLAWIAIGIARLRRMRRRATDAAAGFEDLQAAIGVATPVHWSPDARHPVTFGVLRPIVLLPDAVKAADTAVQRAVVAHELHHVKRRDWVWTIAEEVVRSAFWFHPAMWWLVSRVQLARETVVDELSILTTNGRRAYLDALLALADDAALSSSTAFSARRHLFHRVMLIAKEGGMSSIRIAAVSGALAVALGAGSWTAVNAFPLYGAAAEQAQKPPRDPRTPADYHRLAQEYWDKANKDLSLTPGQKLEVVLKGIELEDRALAMNPDYAISLMSKHLLVRMQARLTTDSAMKAKLLTQAEELREKALANDPPPPPPPPPPRAGRSGVQGGVPGGVAGGVVGGVVGGVEAEPQMVFMPESYERHMKELNPVRIGGGVKQPMKIKDVRPVYPPLAQSARVQGVVIIEAIIDADGMVVDARVLRSIPLLDEAALDAVRQWVFSPTNLNGTPTAVTMTVTVNFTLQ